MLDQEREKWKAIWKGSDLPRPASSPLPPWQRQGLQAAGVDVIRKASSAYSSKSAIGGDGFHMRHYSFLSDGGLQCVAAIWMAMELISAIPGPIDHTCLIMLVKPSGGYRPIGLFSSLYRLYTRIMICECMIWELKFPRSYFRCAARQSSVDCVW